MSDLMSVGQQDQFLARVKQEVGDQIVELRDDISDDIKSLQSRDKMLMGGVLLLAGLVVLEGRAVAMLTKAVAGIAQQVNMITQALTPPPTAPPVAPPPAPTVVRQNGYDPPAQEAPADVKQRLAEAPNADVEAPEAL